MIVQLAIALVILLVASFVVSGVLPAFFAYRRRKERVEAFRAKYHGWVAGSEDNREWLMARRAEMQRDANSVSLGTTMIAPPPMMGGGPYQRHDMFFDLLSEQSYSEYVTEQVRLDTLAAAEHELQTRTEDARRRVLNPAAWLQLAFERIARLPRYLLRTAGFSKRVTESGFARVVTVLWSFLVGAATIASFVVLIIQSP